eukprot:GFYU01005641.1.p1 GENE.GFYU01005641.1~~GFYU01005641.1.p1  ORF type:complete len:206 (-),score=31.52 GFYU01005641.1:201-818(-)
MNDDTDPTSTMDDITAGSIDDYDDQHPLQHKYVLWFVRRTPGSRSQESYEKNIKKICSFGSVEAFWRYYNHLVRPSDLPNTSDYLLFKEGIKPMWEDEANAKGGKWIVRLKKGLASQYWEDLLFGTVGDQFDVGEEICGAVVSIRFQEDIISVWNRSANDRETTLKIRDTIKRVLQLPSNTVMEYKAHDASMKDNSSFRNTDVFR